MEQGTTLDDYRKELQRTAWRIAYHQRKIKTKEQPWNEWGKENEGAAQEGVDEEFRLREYLELIPFDNGRRIIEEIFVRGETEAGTAAKLQISQQGVNKWKRKSLDHLRQTLTIMNS
ncbi:hypothetical protein B9G55_17340 [Saccharibacillus sp. O16]|nr:hypothetical protein B9G55_17340 [Saccharibacillus sp. O16]